MENNIAPPIYVFWDATGKCNLRCIHCRELSKTDSEDLAYHDIIRLIDDLCDLGVEFLGILGGEPLLRDDLFEIISYSKEKGLSIGLGTNGTLINSNTARIIKQNDVDICFVSIDGPERINDSIRGKGSFRKAINGIKNLKDLKIPVGIRMTLMPHNINEWKDVIDLSILLDVELSIR